MPSDSTSLSRMDLAVTPTIHMPIKWTLEGTLRQINKFYPYLNAPEALEKFFECYIWMYYHMPQNSKWTYAAERLLTEAKEMVENDDADFYSLLCTVTQDKTPHLPLSELIDVSVVPIFVEEIIDLETVSIVSDPISERDVTPTVSLPFGVKVKEEPQSPKLSDKNITENIASTEYTNEKVKLEETDIPQLNSAVFEGTHKQPKPDQEKLLSPSNPEHNTHEIDYNLTKARGTNVKPYQVESPPTAFYQTPLSKQTYPMLYPESQYYAYQDEFDNNYQYSGGHRQMSYYQEAVMYNPHYYYHHPVSSVGPVAQPHFCQYQGSSSKVKSPVPILKKSKSLPDVLMKRVEGSISSKNKNP